MQSKFPSEYFVFLKSVGLISPCDCDAAVFRSASESARLRVREVGRTRWVSGLLSATPTPTLISVCKLQLFVGFDVGLGRVRVEDLRGALRRGEVSREELIKKTRVARKAVGSLLPPSPHRHSATTFPGPCASCLQFPPLSPFLPLYPYFWT